MGSGEFGPPLALQTWALGSQALVAARALCAVGQACTVPNRQSAQGMGQSSARSGGQDIVGCLPLVGAVHAGILRG